MSAVSSSTTTDPGMQFRLAAARGDTKSMLAMYKSKSITNIREAGKNSGKTAAHFAAEKGQATALRLLFSLGDPLNGTDLQGQTPEQLASTQECKEVFKLIEIGRKALEVSLKIFPITVHCDKCNTIELEKFLKWRDALKDKVLKSTTEVGQMQARDLMEEYKEAKKKKESLNCGEDLCDWYDSYGCTLSDLYIHFYMLDLSAKLNVNYGGCGERSTASYTYLTSRVKTHFPVDRVSVFTAENNHAFVVLNRNQNLPLHNLNGWNKALIIDGFENRIYFYENLEVSQSAEVTPQTLVEGSLQIVYSTKALSPPKTPWQPKETIKKIKEHKIKLEDEIATKLDVLIKERAPNSDL